MKADERRKEIITLLMAKDGAVSGGELSERLNTSRQIIVQDIAILRAAGYEILSTHQGYVVKNTPLIERVFKLRHTSDQTEDELTCIVNLGGTVVDVFVWHKVYGKVEANMNIFSQHSIDKFMEGIKSGKSTELMNITSGYHYHTVRAESKEVLDRIEAALEERGYIVPEI
ncbi:MAG: transcription repressor NadR [Oscillospiraceae bacterium]|nr:transcription repressor NadR [Oscillospiraceae bacterium]MBQ9939414.1 transcription repressor NadR [Oscillospiraceae bacterium]